MERCAKIVRRGQQLELPLRDSSMIPQCRLRESLIQPQTQIYLLPAARPNHHQPFF